jgi:hypothetical protein
MLEPHVKAMDITGKPMKGWTMVAAEGVAAEAAVKEWVQRATKICGEVACEVECRPLVLGPYVSKKPFG